MLKKLVIGLLLPLLMSSNIYATEQSPSVIIQTNKGDITLELYPEKAPKTVENFLKYVDSGFYEGTIFHRVIAGFMV
ncbi:MAG: peptidylprolyl isomerase A, partial [Oceanospirillaceae bacterium]|nr:peptidylprolyl isomerase A [Oceanospirillaceae bacterium]